MGNLVDWMSRSLRPPCFQVKRNLTHARPSRCVAECGAGAITVIATYQAGPTLRDVRLRPVAGCSLSCVARAPDLCCTVTAGSGLESHLAQPLCARSQSLVRRRSPVGGVPGAGPVPGVAAPVGKLQLPWCSDLERLRLRGRLLGARVWRCEAHCLPSWRSLAACVGAGLRRLPWTGTAVAKAIVPTCRATCPVVTVRAATIALMRV